MVLRVFFMTLLLLPTHAWAYYVCSVKVANVLIYQDGSVNVLHSGRGDYTYICNLASERDQVSTTTCAMWTSMLLAIKKKNGDAQFYYNGEGSCSTIPTYSAAPAPLYIGDVTQ